MFETTHPDPPLATARDLAAYHTRRERFYGAAAMLLASAPDRATLTVLRRRFAWTAIDTALAGDDRATQVEFARLFGGAVPRVDIRCADPQSPSRLAALEHAALPVSPDIVAELRTLAILADRTAAAIECGDIAEAATLCDVQARFLSPHAATCIRNLTGQLIAAALPFYAALGRALAAQIDEDLRLFAD